MCDKWHQRQVNIEKNNYKKNIDKIRDECPFQFNHIYKITEIKHNIPYPIKGIFYFKGVYPEDSRPYIWSMQKKYFYVDKFTSTTNIHWEEVTEIEMKQFQASLQDSVTHIGVGEITIKV
jgi:hypothetical protein